MGMGQEKIDFDCMSGQALSLLNRARAYADLEEPDLALEYYGQLFRNHQNIPATAWTEGATLLRQRGHLAAAEACLRRAITLQPAHIHHTPGGRQC